MTMRMIIALIIGLVLTLARPPSGQAGDTAAERPLRIPRSTLPGLGSDHDPRVMVDVSQSPWRALGRIQTEAGGGRGNGIWCTGALIGPRTVVTQARCLVSISTRHFLRPDSVHFALAYNQGAYAGHARATRFAVARGFDPTVERPSGAEWALITLEAPLGTPDRVLRLIPEVPATQQPVALA